MFPPKKKQNTKTNALKRSQSYDGEIVDDYITGVEQVGVDPTVAAETAAAPVDAGAKVDANANAGGDAYEFKEYDLEGYDDPAYPEKSVIDEDYSYYGVKPTSLSYEEDFGTGAPAAVDISVSVGEVRRRDATSNQSIVLTIIELKYLMNFLL